MTCLLYMKFGAAIKIREIEFSAPLASPSNANKSMYLAVRFEAAASSPCQPSVVSSAESFSKAESTDLLGKIYEVGTIVLSLMRSAECSYSDSFLVFLVRKCWLFV